MYHINQANNYQLILMQSFFRSAGVFFICYTSTDKTQLEVMFNENAAGIILFVLFFLLRYKCKAF